MPPSPRPARGAAAALLTVLVLAFVGCGGDSETTTVTETTEPTTTSQPTTTSEPTTTDSTTTEDSGGVGPGDDTVTQPTTSGGDDNGSGGSGPDDSSGDGGSGGSGSGKPDPSKPDSAGNDLPPKPGTPQAKFEQYCNQHPGACG
jgi:hypothetical protein